MVAGPLLSPSLAVKDDHSPSLHDDEYSPHLKIAATAKRGVSLCITSELKILELVAASDRVSRFALLRMSII